MADPAAKPDERKPAGDKAAAAPHSPSLVIKARALFTAFKWPVIGACGAILVLGAGASWYFLHDTRPEPPVLLARALECLKDRDNAEASVEARRITSELDALHYRDPDFMGAIPYILGVIDFRKAQQQTDRERVESMRSAAAHLERAADGLDAAHRLDGLFTLGMALSAIGDVAGRKSRCKRPCKTSKRRKPRLRRRSFSRQPRPCRTVISTFTRRPR